MNILKKTIIILCVFALVLSLFGCGGKPRYPENYSVAEHEGHWSILYTDEKGVEEIAVLGDERQPLVMQGGRLWFTDGSKLVTVDPEGEDRLETELTGMPDGTTITFSDQDNFYCVARQEDVKCWRVSKADQSDWAHITIPRIFRNTDYAAISAAVLDTVKAKDNVIRVRAARVELDSNGSVIAMELDILRYKSVTLQMKTWDTGTVSVRMQLNGPVVTYTDRYIPLSVSDKTLKSTLLLEDYLAAVEAADNGLIATQQAQGQAEGFRLMYTVPEYEAWLAVNKTGLTYLDTAGKAVEGDLKKQHFVLAQVGGCATQLTDTSGTACGNLTVVQVG
ncbi:MAG: hypothetical protein IJB04_05675 [Oscillospiraceae bacterium]|nr:hypothetical protein [Oscillospiraceae bacterium]